MNSNILGEKDGFLIRLAKAEDAAGYFEQNFCPLDQEVVRLTGCKEEFTKDEVVSFFMKSLKDDERYVLSAFLFNIAQKPLFPIIEWIAGTPFDTGCLLI